MDLAREQPPIPSWIRELYGNCRVSDSHFPYDRPGGQTLCWPLPLSLFCFRPLWEAAGEPGSREFLAVAIRLLVRWRGAGPRFSGPALQDREPDAEPLPAGLFGCTPPSQVQNQEESLGRLVQETGCSVWAPGPGAEAAHVGGGLVCTPRRKGGSPLGHCSLKPV